MTGTDARRRRAADPAASVWVAASAGTGKTTVLTERLLALLLDGTDPGRVLCLTFTRAAAAEMANRLDAQLARWATLPDGALAEEQVALAGHFPDAERLARARQLFARVLDTPGGLRISTIHAFCQSLLRRFPLEARVPPEFAVIDERNAGDLLAEAGERVIALARAGRDAELAAALATVAQYAPEERFAELLRALADARDKVKAVLAGGYAMLGRRVAAALGFPGAATPERLVEEFCAGGEIAALRAAAAALACGSPTDQRRGLVLARWCEAAAERPAMLAEYVAAFLTQQDEIRDVLITKPAARAAEGAAPALAAEAERVKAFRDARAAAVVCAATTALLRLGDALIEAYETRKRAAGALDYDDLVLKALALLRRPGVAPWVLFKLDGGIDHILIDEAQDTNPEQWAIVAALAAEFFSGHGARMADRTIFAVGDVKQSIYSFQGADPQAFLEMRRHFEERIAAARGNWRIVPLELSYRSAEPVLRAVDAIFRQPAARHGVALDGEAIRHQAARRGAEGVVELWPPVVPEPESDEALPLPVARRRVAEPRTRLAHAIAATIRHWLDSGERLAARGRPIAAGDVMVLVRRRNEFVGDLVRALKERDIPVAGADRLVLTEQLAAQDLIALGRFLLLPEDDLTLATVLKGPLFAIAEETLFELAHGRGETPLWRRLRDRAADPALRAIVERLSDLLARADFSPPYELYAQILGAEGGRRAILERLGPEAADPIEEFLSLALAYQREHVPSLQGFLHWLEAGDSEVKRDFGMRRRDEVRILTVHGAKGLEAPIVFLPDTMQVPAALPPLLWPAEGGVPLWCPRRQLAVPACADAKEAERRRQMQEYRRLLYVALTRAEDRLYICGWETRRPAGEACWYALCRSGLADVTELFAFDTRPLIGEDGWAGEGLRLAQPQTARPRPEPAEAAARPAGPPPAWAMRAAPAEPEPPRPLAPSRPEGAEPAAASPLAFTGPDRFRRGLLIHRLLQSLPDLVPAEREGAARRFLALPAHRLSAEEQDDICRATLAVLRHPDFAPLFGPGSQAEVPLVGLIRGHAVSGQIDRLLVEPERVTIVDYKTLRPPPKTEVEVAPIYLRQLAVYRAALARIYPAREIRCALLWTEGPSLMPVGEERLDRWLP